MELHNGSKVSPKVIYDGLLQKAPELMEISEFDFYALATTVAFYKNYSLEEGISKQSTFATLISVLEYRCFQQMRKYSQGPKNQAEYKTYLFCRAICTDKAKTIRKRYKTIIYDLFYI